MNLLALDSSGAACSAAVMCDDRLVAHSFVPMLRGHAEALLPMVQRTLAVAGVGFPDLDLLAVTVGPGAFTGIRIGLAAARGLALARGLPLLGVTCFDAVAAAVGEDERRGRTLVVVLDSKRSELFAQAYDASGHPQGAAAVVAPDALADRLPPGRLLLAGNAAAPAAVALCRAGRDVERAAAAEQPDAAQVARLARERWRPGSPLPPVAPLYLRAPDVTLPKETPR